MLTSQEEERGRKFKLALRAGLPILLLISLVAYGVFWQGNAITFGFREIVLVVALIFVTTYFIFFLLEEDSQKSLIDPTTNGYNYAAFLHHYQTRKPHSLAILTLDNLTIINENYGTWDVDTLLRSLIYLLDATLAAHEIKPPIIGRRYGAEFLIGSEAQEDQLRKAIQAFVTDHPSIEEIEIDLRFATMAEPVESLDKVIGHIHDVILSKKEHPVDRTPNSYAPLQHVLQAVRDHRVLFTFRPLYRVATDNITAYEISAKLRLENGQEILPRTYLPIINRLGHGREYDFVVLQHVLDVLSLVDKRVSFAFNLSPFSLRNKDFQSRVFRLLAQSDIAPSRLIIELYERKAHHNLEGYLKTLESFRAHGIRICIDNFGASSASMEYMRHFTFDMVQFDRDYVGRLEDTKRVAMLQSLVDMSKNLHIATIAKWVDTEEQKQKFVSMGIDYLQGYGIARPLTEQQIIDTYN